jgi:hypothetical protein
MLLDSRSNRNVSRKQRFPDTTQHPHHAVSFKDMNTSYMYSIICILRMHTNQRQPYHPLTPSSFVPSTRCWLCFGFLLLIRIGHICLPLGVHTTVNVLNIANSPRTIRPQVLQAVQWHVFVPSVNERIPKCIENPRTS